MRHITKNKAPDKFLSYAKGKGANYKDLVNNHPDIYQEVRKSLLEEQGYICCYCGCSINENNAHIEHIKSQHNYQNEDLDYYNNMLGCCDGGSFRKDKSERTKEKHCDKSKDDKDIEINPLQENCAELFIYYKDGKVRGKSEAAKKTIEVLNLNSPILVNRRKVYLTNYDAPRYTKSWIDEIKYLNEKIDGKYMEFNFVLISYIENIASNQITQSISI